MKKVKLILFGFVALFYNLSLIGAIKCNESGTITNYGLTIYKKSCGNKIAFCTRFKADAPHGMECSKWIWSSNDNKNQAISYAVGYIIKSYGVTKFNGAYTLAESAINKFLYKITDNKETYDNYYINMPGNIKNSYNARVSKALKIYNNRKNGKEKNSNGDKKIQISSASISGNKLTVKVKCYNKYGERSCDGLSVKATAGNAKYSMKKDKDDSEKFTLDISEIRENYKEGNTFTINISASKTSVYYAAVNYKCGKYQSLALNEYSENSETVKATKQIKSTGTKELDPPKTYTRTCQSLVNIVKNTYTNKKSENYYNFLKSIYKLGTGGGITINNVKYTCSNCQSNTFTELFNLSNPSCQKIDNDSDDLACNGIATKYNFIQNTYDGSGNTYYCTSQFSLDTSETIGTDYKFNYGDLLYRSSDGVVATGKLSYSCQIPSGHSVKVTPTLPSLTLVANDQTVKFISTLSSSFVTLNGSSPNYTFNAKYKYPDNFKDESFGEYGFKTDINWKEGNSTLTLSGATNITSKSTANCPYSPNPIDNKWKADLLYRGIDTSSPFLNYEGTSRKTGANWCATELSDITDESNVTEDSIVQNSGIDIRNIYKDADGDNYSPIFDLNDNSYLDVLDTMIIQGGVTKYTALYFKKDFNLDEYNNDSENIEWNNFIQYLSNEDNHNIIYSCSVDDVNSVFANGPSVDYEDYEVYIVDELQNDLRYDFNNDGKVDIRDTTYLRKLLGEAVSVQDKKYSTVDIKAGDINFDGKVDGEDYSLLSGILESPDKIADLNIIKKYYADCDRNGYLNDDDLKCISNDVSDSDLDENGVLKVPDKLDQDSQTDFITRSESEQLDAYCSYNNMTVKNYIKNRPTADGKKSSNSNENAQPLYSFTLTPDNIKKIREYNNGKSYDDFSLECKNNNKECVSSFVYSMFTDKNYAVESSGLCQEQSSSNKFCDVSSVLEVK